MPDTFAPPSILDQLVQRTRRLYSLPTVAMQVLELTQSPEVNLRALTECLERDPALVSKILRVVNSSLFGQSRRIADLNHAVTVLGVKPLKLLVLGFNLPEGLFSGVSPTALEHYWRHTLTKAVACRELAESVWHTSGDEPFIAGLLQDLGMLVLLQELGGPYTKFLEGVARDAGDLLTLEMSTLGFDHAVLSARLFEHWGLPESLVRAVALPHDTVRLLKLADDEQALPQMLHLAELIAQYMAGHREVALAELMAAGKAYRDLTAPQVEAVLARLQEKVTQLSQVMSVQLPNCGDYRDLLVRAHKELALAAEDAVQTSPPAAADITDDLWREAQGLSEAVQKFIHPKKVAAAPRRQSAPAHSPRKTGADTAQGEAGLLSRVAAAVSHCRQLRCAVSLVLVELDQFSDLVLTRGWDSTKDTIERLEASARQLAAEYGTCVQVTDARFALVLENCDRNEAVNVARQLIKGSKPWSTGRNSEGGAPVTLSGGVASLALPPRNFAGSDLIDAALRCLNAVKAGGGDAVKSIGV